MLDSYKMVDYYPAFVKPTRYVDGFRQSAPKSGHRMTVSKS